MRWSEQLSNFEIIISLWCVLLWVRWMRVCGVRWGVYITYQLTCLSTPLHTHTRSVIILSQRCHKRETEQELTGNAAHHRKQLKLEYRKKNMIIELECRVHNQSKVWKTPIKLSMPIHQKVDHKFYSL